jgi:hypothetical protein
MKTAAHNADVTNEVAECVLAKTRGATIRVAAARTRTGVDCNLSDRQTTEVRIDKVTTKARKFFEPKMPINAKDRDTPSYLYSPKANERESDTRVDIMTADRK